MDWGDVFDCQQADPAYETFLSHFTRTYNIHFPLISKRIGKTKTEHPWITQGIVNSSCSRKNKLYRRFLRNPSDANKRLYNSYQNRLTSIIRHAKKYHYAKKLDKCKNDMKRTWREINKILGKEERLQLRTITLLVIKRLLIRRLSLIPSTLTLLTLTLLLLTIHLLMLISRIIFTILILPLFFFYLPVALR